MDSAEALFPWYFLTFAILGISQLLFLHGRSPREKRYWFPRLSILNLLVIGGFLVAIILASGQWLSLFLFVPFMAIIGYLGLTRIVICQRCGATVQPQYLIEPSQFCPRCGAELERGPIFPPRSEV